MSAITLSERQRQLLASVTRRASHVSEQTMLLTVEANRVGASERDVRAASRSLLPVDSNLSTT